MKLNERRAYYTRVLEDGRVIDVVPLTLGRARLVISYNVVVSFWTDGW